MQIKHLPSNSINKELVKFRFTQDVEKAINGGIAFGVPSNVILTPTQTFPQRCVNIDGVIIVVLDTGILNTEFSVIHNLNRIPQLYDIKRISAACSVYDSGTAWTKTKIFLKCNISHAKITLHIH